MKRSALALILLLATGTLHAQYDTSNGSAGSFGTAGMEGLNPDSTTVNPAVNPPNACPVSLRAQHLSDGDLVKTGIAHPRGIGQALHLTLSSLSRGPVAQATILLRGFTPKGRLSQAVPEAKPNATRSRRVHFAPGQNQSADIWVAGLSAITSVEIVSVTFTDGSSWTPSGSLSCRVTPDLFMQVSP